MLGFARNSGLGRLQALLDRIGADAFAGRKRVAVLGAMLPEDQSRELTDRGIGAAWTTQFNPSIEFDGTDLAQRIAPWLFTQPDRPRPRQAHRHPNVAGELRN